MDNTTNTQEPLATAEKLAQATDLLARAGLSSPATRLMCETVIATKVDSSVTELITYLQELIAEKETAYNEFKAKMAEIAKEMLPAPTATPTLS